MAKSAAKTTPLGARPKRRLHVVGFDGTYFGEDLIELRWRAEDGTVAQAIFSPVGWDLLPAWAERRYEAAVTAHPAPTHFDVVRVPPAQSPAPPAPVAPAPEPSAPWLERSRRRSRPPGPPDGPLRTPVRGSAMSPDEPSGSE